MSHNLWLRNNQFENYPSSSPALMTDPVLLVILMSCWMSSWTVLSVIPALLLAMHVTFKSVVKLLIWRTEFVSNSVSIKSVLMTSSYFQVKLNGFVPVDGAQFIRISFDFENGRGVGGILCESFKFSLLIGWWQTLFRRTPKSANQKSCFGQEF